MRFNNFKTYLSSTSEQVQVVDSTDRQFFLEDKYIVLQRFFHFQRGLFKTSLWSRLCRLRHLSLHCGLQLPRFFYSCLPSCQSQSFILLPRIWNVRFYAQELNLVNWGWRSSLLQQVVIWPDCLDVWLKCHRPSTLSQVYKTADLRSKRAGSFGQCLNSSMVFKNWW